ncbi:MAG: hypothetical protein HWE22_01455 [Flavobacteriales bacterium]|nr:hypothetical protein [Flavobacteriales bacterium]
MRKTKGIIVLFSALFLLFGSIGISVFLHTCEEDGTFVSYFAPVDEEDHCDDAHQDEPVCCSIDEQEEDDDCCDDEVKIFKLKLDFFQKVTTSFVPLTCSPEPVFSANAEFNEELFVVHTYAKPPPKKRSVVRSLSQVWIL